MWEDIVGRNFREFPEKCVTSQKICRKFLRSFSGNVPKIPGNFLEIVGLILLKYNDTERKSIFYVMYNTWKFEEISGKFREISENSGKFPKFAHFSRKIPGKICRQKVVFFDKTALYRLIEKYENDWILGGKSPKIPKFPEIPEIPEICKNSPKFSRNFPKITEIYTFLYVVYTSFQPGNLKRAENSPKFSPKKKKVQFREISGNFRNFRDFDPPKKTSFLLSFGTEKGCEHPGKFGEIRGNFGTFFVQNLSKIPENGKKWPFFLIKPRCSSLCTQLTWRENYHLKIFFFRNHFFFRLDAILSAWFCQFFFLKKKWTQDFFAPMAPLSRRGGSVFLTFFRFKTRYLNKRDFDFGESVCSTFI